MSEIKRRAKKENPPPAETAAPPPPPGPTRVTLTKDVSSRYRKLVPRARAGGSASARPPRPKSPATRPERDAPPKPPRRNDSGQERGGPGALRKNFGSGGGSGALRKNSGSGGGPGAFRKSPGPGGGSGALRKNPGRDGGPDAFENLIRRDLPEMAKQLRETQDLLRVTAEDILSLLEEWTRRPAEETRDAQALVTALFEKMSFHDLAGQRLTKVENFLKALAETTRPGPSTTRFPPRPARPVAKSGQAEAYKTKPGLPRRSKPFSKADQAEGYAAKPGPRRTRTQVSEGKTLKGPQAAGGGLDQREIEALMSELSSLEGRE